MKRYIVTKQFISGILSGCTVEERTDVLFEVGKTYTPCVGSSAYTVIKIERLK